MSEYVHVRVCYGSWSIRYVQFLVESKREIFTEGNDTGEGERGEGERGQKECAEVSFVEKVVGVEVGRRKRD